MVATVVMPLEVARWVEDQVLVLIWWVVTVVTVGRPELDQSSKSASEEKMARQPFALNVRNFKVVILISNPTECVYWTDDTAIVI
jgi:hypothetical protein